MNKLLHILLFVPLTFLGQSFLSIEQDSPLELYQGWNMFGYSCYEPIDVAIAFTSINDKIVIVKDNSGNVYMPEFTFNGIGDLVYNRGYQIKLSEAITDFQFCPAIVPLVEGCMDATAFNYNSSANTDDGSCIIYGCTNPYSQGGLYNPLANVDDGSCILIGCADSMYVEYYTQGFIPSISEEVYNDLFCFQVAVFGCTDNGWLPNALGEINDSDSDANPAVNYNPDANIDDGSCITEIMGCTDTSAFNYNPSANIDDDSCYPISYGCLDPTAFNFNDYDFDGLSNVITGINGIDVNTSNGSCYPIIYGCLDPDSFNFNDYDYDFVGNELTVINGVDVNTNNGICIPVEEGCTDPNANNFTQFANTDDGTCIYDTYEVGDLTQGGIVFYVDETGQHGLVAAMEDLTEGTTINSEGNPGYQWGCFGTGISGANGQAIGTGYQNTLDIASGCSETPIAASEALACESEDYSDWYLPSLDELNEMYNTIGTGGSGGNIGGFSSNWYWSSSESNNYGAYDVNFGDGSTGNFSSKTKIVRVRVIRSF